MYKVGYHNGKEWYRRSVSSEYATLNFGHNDRSVEWLKGFSDGFKAAKIEAKK